LNSKLVPLSHDDIVQSAALLCEETENDLVISTIPFNPQEPQVVNSLELVEGSPVNPNAPNSQAEASLTLTNQSKPIVKKRKFMSEWIQTQELVKENSVRFIKALLFLYKTWIFQCNLNSERGKVMLSILRNLPLLDAYHHQTLYKLRDTPVLIIW
jgi:hypothetical protein